jgi:hypothetical protein
MPVLVSACVDDAAAGSGTRTNWERPEAEWVQELEAAGFDVTSVHRDGLQFKSPRPSESLKLLAALMIGPGTGGLQLSQLSRRGEGMMDNSDENVIVLNETFTKNSS